MSRIKCHEAGAGDGSIILLAIWLQLFLVANEADDF